MKTTHTNCTFSFTDINEVKKKMLNWANRFSIFCFLDSHNYQTGPHSIDCILAAGVKRQFSAEPGNALAEFQKFIDHNQYGQRASTDDDQ